MEALYWLVMILIVVGFVLVILAVCFVLACIGKATFKIGFKETFYSIMGCMIGYIFGSAIIGAIKEILL